jgi:hypothetical protein
VATDQVDELRAGASEGYALDDSGHLFGTDSAGDLGRVSSLTVHAPRRARHGRVTLTGRLSPGLAGAAVELSYRPVAGGGWVHQSVGTGVGGSFSLTVRIRRRTAFVAQWGGDSRDRAAGSSVVVVSTG